MGGAVTGLFFGVVLLRNREKKVIYIRLSFDYRSKGFERCFTAVSLIAFIGYVAALIMVWYMIVQNDEIQNVFDVELKVKSESKKR